MRRHPGLLLALLSLWLGGHASLVAQGEPSAPPQGKPPHRQISTNCPQCASLVTQVNQAYDALDYLWDRRLALQKSIGVTEKAMADRAAAIGRMERARPPSGRTAQQQGAIDALKDVNAQQQRGVDRHRRDLAEVDRQIAAQNGKILKLSVQLGKCEARCKPAQTTPTQTTPAQTTQATPARSRPIPCTICRPYADLILRLEQEMDELLEEQDEIEAEIDFIANETAMGRPVEPWPFGTPQSSPGVQAQRAMSEVSSELAEVDAQLFRAWAGLTSCILTCNAGRSIISRPLVYGSVLGGAAVGGVLAAGGSGDSSPALTSSPPVSAAPPAMPSNPSPSPMPAPEPTPTPSPGPANPASTQNVINCACIEDSAQRDALLRFCQLVRQLAFRLINATTVEIAGASPLGTVQGQLNPTTGAIDLTAMTTAGPLRLTATVDAGGNLTNATAAFGDGTMRTVYRFETSRVQ